MVVLALFNRFVNSK